MQIIKQMDLTNSIRIIPKIESILIKNKGIIKRAEIKFKPGLNIILGNAGAGKTRILEAIGQANIDNLDFLKCKDLNRPEVSTGENYVYVLTD